MLQAHFCIFSIHTGRDQHIIKRKVYSPDLSRLVKMEGKSPEHTGIKRQTGTTKTECKSESSESTPANSIASRKKSAQGEAYKESKSKKATDGMSSNRTPEKAGTGTIKLIVKDAEGRSRMKETDNDSEATTKITTEGRKMDGAKEEVDKTPGNTIEKTSAGGRKNRIYDNADKANKAVSRAGNATICKRNDGELDNDEESVSKAVIKATMGAESKAFDKEPVNKGRKAKTGNKAMAEVDVEPISNAKKATTGRGNKADKADVEPVGAVRKATPAEENKELHITNLEPVSKAKKATTGKGNKASDKATPGEKNIELDKANAEPISKGGKAYGGNKALDKADVEPVSTATTTEAEKENLAQAKLTMHLKRAVEMLKPRLCDISPAAEKVNKLVNDFLMPILYKDPAFQGTEILTTGSYYEKVKISKPNEFDIMLKIPCERLHITESNVSGGYYMLKLKRNPGHPLTEYEENGNISGQKMLNQLRELIRSNIIEMRITLERKSRTSPAVTILIDENHDKISVDLVLALQVKGSWPSSTSEGMKIETWLGAKVKQEYKYKPMYFVAKQLKNTEEVLWRISFSHIEKLILMNHGNAKTCCESKRDKCCRKQCLKLMKYLLEQLNSKGSRNMTHFCSYHAKTALLHSCTLYPKDEDWKPEHIAGCFGRYIEYFIKCLKEANLPNFFIPSLNLFSEEFIPKTSLKYLRTKLKEQLSQDYPLFESRATESGLSTI
ncbi:cyclic GMP-AMP synthase isoform X2 [Xenopus laevis]|uniref:Cyclic GMP-AMP synthase isoform X2 n=1 Tax=Xenopus laevis TaxID=8355 RepID=A0A8J1KTH4_XENLA|nr:cyclic GMP-AMP synthase isoform X2 [Xenopus laevis]